MGSRLGASVVFAEVKVPPLRVCATAGAAATAAAEAESARKRRRLMLVRRAWVIVSSRVSVAGGWDT
jgi:hypothetical protein